jgi:hypothetical protein
LRGGQKRRVLLEVQAGGPLLHQLVEPLEQRAHRGGPLVERELTVGEPRRAVAEQLEQLAQVVLPGLVDAALQRERERVERVFGVFERAVLGAVAQARPLHHRLERVTLQLGVEVVVQLARVEHRHAELFDEPVHEGALEGGVVGDDRPPREQLFELGPVLGERGLRGEQLVVEAGEAADDHGQAGGGPEQLADAADDLSALDEHHPDLDHLIRRRIEAGGLEVDERVVREEGSQRRHMGGTLMRGSDIAHLHRAVSQRCRAFSSI